MTLTAVEDPAEPEWRIVLSIDEITKRISGKGVSHIEMREDAQLAIVFADGSALRIRRLGQDWALDFDPGRFKCPATLQPTSRQREYLEFINKYMLRFGISPAEADIQRHFLVSAPSVNSMMQALERYGFITRQPRVARSTRVVAPAQCAICGGIHHLKRDLGALPRR
jgi:hypothetical protein